MKTNPLTEQELNEIQARADAASPGPWFEHADPRKYVYIPNASDEQVIFDRDKNAQFCAHAREDVPCLVAEVRRLQAKVAMYEKWIAEVVEAYKREPPFSQLLNVGRAITWRVEHPEDAA